jgi:Zn-dependent protease
MHYGSIRDMKFEIKWSTCLFCALVVAVLTPGLGWAQATWAAAAVVSSVLLHELGHAAIARSYGVTVKLVGISLKGGYTVRSRSDRMHVEALTTLAGPMVNLLLFALFAIISGKANGFIAASNLVLAITNLVPLGPSDGLRLLKLFTSPR